MPYAPMPPATGTYARPDSADSNDASTAHSPGTPYAAASACVRQPYP